VQVRRLLCPNTSVARDERGKRGGSSTHCGTGTSDKTHALTKGKVEKKSCNTYNIKIL
jgi:hypothetical protein